MRRMRTWMVLLAALLMLLPGCAAAQAASERAPSQPLGELDVLVGTWHAEGSGFSTTLTYRWLLPGRMLEAVNDVHGADGNVVARYRGAYAWDAGREEVVFWTAAESGEVHRGRAWWQDGALWHEADVSGGSIESYASVVRRTQDRLEYFADYGAPHATPALLATEPLRYRRGSEP